MFQIKTFNYAILLALLLISNLAISQRTKPSTIKQYLSLNGEVNMLCVFVETDEEDWAEDEMEFYYRQYLQSQLWIQNEAEFYDQELSFDNEQFFVDNKRIIKLDQVSRRHSPSATVKRVMIELGYLNFEDFISKNGFNFKEEKLKIVLMVKQASRSHAYNYWSVNKVDLAIVYCRSTYGNLTDKYVMAHEILHQFGAWDLYFGKSQSSESAKKALQLYPNSIMINTHRNQESLEVDAVTAWRLGWEEYDESYSYFDPRNHKEQAQEDMKSQEMRRTGKKSTELKFNLGKKKKN